MKNFEWGIISIATVLLKIYHKFFYSKGSSYHSQLQDMSRHCSFTSDEEYEVSDRKRYNQQRLVIII